MFDQLKKAHALIKRIHKAENQIEESKEINEESRSAIFDSICFLIEYLSVEERELLIKKYSK